MGIYVCATDAMKVAANIDAEETAEDMGISRQGVRDIIKKFRQDCIH